MATQTGNIIKRYVDTNVNSPTFGEEKVVIYEDLTHCPKGDPTPTPTADWVEISREPHMVTYFPSGVDGYSGYADVTYQDQNEESPTYGQTKVKTEKDRQYPKPSQEPSFELYTEYCDTNSYCEDVYPISDEDIENLFE